MHVGARRDLARHAGQLQQRDGTGQGTGLEHQDHFVAVSGQADARRPWQDDVPQRLAPGHAERTRRFDFPGWHVLNRATQNLGYVRCGMQGHGDDRAPVGVTQVGPERTLAHHLELRHAVVDEEQLHQQRRATKEEDVSVRQCAYRQNTRRARDAQRQRQDQSGNDRNADQLQCQPGAFHKAR